MGPTSQSTSDRFRHHRNYAGLVSSASSGCQMCGILLDAHLGYYEEQPELRYTRQDAHELNIALDQDGDYSFHIRGENATLQNSDGVYGFEFYRSKPGNHGFDESAEDGYLELMLQRLSLGSVARMSPPSYYGGATILLEAWNGSASQLEDRVVGKSVRPYSDFVLARQWIRECQENHPECVLSTASPLLPTRVVYVGPAAGTQEPRLLETRGRRGHYVALSHCWGGTSSLMTTTSNYEQHMVKIPFRALPRTFQDAIVATRRLAFNYLWIDCLCIIQGSTEDWARECAKMTETFQNASVTIAGAAAGNTEAGFLHPRIPSAFPRHVWEYQDGPSNTPRRVTIRRKGVTDLKFGQHEPNSPLDGRAWILQEQLLCSRNLYFGRRQMYFECVKHTNYEDSTCTEASGGVHLVAKWQVRRPQAVWGGKITQLWYRVLVEFTKRNLTDPSDKLPALSGLARWLWAQTDDAYVAGLSKNDIHMGMSWFVQPRRKGAKVSSTGSSTVSRTTYRGPSWSWVSSDHPIRFYHMLSHVDYRAHHQGGYDVLCDLEVVRLDVRAATQDPYGLVASRSLWARGRVKWTSVRKTRASDRGITLELYSPLCPLAEFFPDDPSLWDHWPYCEDGGLAAYEILRPCVLVCECRGWFALVLEPCDDKEGRYRRIGIAGNSRGPVTYNGRLPSDEWFNDADRIELEIV